MLSFVLILPIVNSRPSSRSPPKCTASPLPLDPLKAFEAFCQRTKTTLSTQTAEADGLATFYSPFTYPPANPHPLSLTSGKRFTASVDLFRSPPYTHQSVGIVLKLIPKDPTLPSLRADVHYFQTSSSWWFSGAADLIAGPAGDLATYTARFLRPWGVLHERYRNDMPELGYLNVCYGASTDREMAFGFVGDVVDGFLPAYLPLLIENVHGDGVTDGEVCQSFYIIGGAACETSTVTKGPFVSWNFSLAPSTMTTAGRVYDTLREGAFCQGNVYFIR